MAIRCWYISAAKSISKAQGLWSSLEMFLPCWPPMNQPSGRIVVSNCGLPNKDLELSLVVLRAPAGSQYEIANSSRARSATF